LAAGAAEHAEWRELPWGAFDCWSERNLQLLGLGGCGGRQLDLGGLGLSRWLLWLGLCAFGGIWLWVAAWEVMRGLLGGREIQDSLARLEG